MKFQCSSYLEIYDVNLVIDFRKLKNAKQKNKRRLCFVFINLVWTKNNSLIYSFQTRSRFRVTRSTGSHRIFFSLFFLQPGSVASLDRAEFQNYALVQGFFWRIYDTIYLCLVLQGISWNNIKNHTQFIWNTLVTNMILFT